jgi:DNA polymerase
MFTNTNTMPHNFPDTSPIHYKQKGTIGNLFECKGRCPECPNEYRLVHSDGPVPSEVMLIGEAPGREEDRGGRPFIGKSGKELNENYLTRMHLSRPSIYFTNSVKCRPEGNKKPNDKLRTSCAGHYLAEEVRMVQPKVILLLGATACALPNLEIELEKDHGFPIKLSPGQGGLLGDYTGYVIPLYHPAAGMHNTSMMIPLLEDANNVGRWIMEEWEPPVDNFPSRDYRLLDTKADLLNHLINLQELTLSVDTESTSSGALYSAQWSQFPGTGYAILAEQRPLLSTFIEFCNDGPMDFLAQNTKHDYRLLYNLGLRVDRFRIQDTMQRAFQHGNYPQGLKAMSNRLLGIRMESFMDVVLPPSLDVLSMWIELAKDYCESIAPMQLVVIDRVKTRFLMRPKPTPQLKELSRIVKTDKDRFKKAAAFYEKNGLEAANLPPPPRPGIEHAGPEIALWYMCQDPDVTLRSFLEFLRITEEKSSMGEFATEVASWRKPELDLVVG